MYYVTAVLDLLAAYGLKEAEFSPEDFSAIAEWEKQEIPLEFLIESIKRYCENSNRNIRSEEFITKLEGHIFREYTESLRGKRSRSFYAND
ncbi:MAG: hypothetical protein ACRD6X_00525 [Pyrinomonadaceae bacterium]